MSIFSKTIIFSLALFCLLTFGTDSAQALENTCGPCVLTTDCDAGLTCLSQTCQKQGTFVICPPNILTAFKTVRDAILKYFLVVSFGLGPLMMLVAGLYIFFGGNPENIEKAKKVIWITLCVMLIAALSKGIISLLENISRAK